MTRDERLKSIQQRLRESHRSMWKAQSDAIASLRVVLDSIARAHDEMAVLYQADNDLEDTLADGEP